MKKITKKIYQDAINSHKEKDDYDHNTLTGIHSTGRMIFEKAIELGVIKIDPTEYVMKKEASQKFAQLMENL